MSDDLQRHRWNTSMNELPAEAIAYWTFLTDVQSLLASSGRDSAFGWVAAAAAACGLVFIARAWAVYSTIAAVVLLYGLHEALERFQQSLAS